MSQVIIITGMHRSGTSLVTSFLQKAGIHIGNNLLVPGKENPRGFFEDIEFFEFHEAALHARQKTYLVDKAFSFFPTQQELETAQALLDKRLDQEVWGWKDPRTALFLQFWSGLLPEAHYLFLFRHPLEVLLSLVRSQYVYNIGLVEGLKAWQVYNEAIASFYEANPERCALCHIHSLLTDFTSFEQILHKKLKLRIKPPSGVVDTLYHETELHQLPITGEIQHLLSQLFAGITTLYDHLNAIADLPAPAQTPPDVGNVSELLLLRQVAEKLPAEADPSTVVKRGLLQLLLATIEPEITEAFYRHHLDHLFETGRAKDKFWNELQSLGKDWEAQRQYISGQQRHIEKQQNHIAKQQDFISGQQTYAQGLETDKVALEEQVDQLQTQLDRMTEQQVRIQSLEANKVALEEQVDQLQTQLDRMTEQQVRIQGLEANKVALEEQVDQLQTQLDRMTEQQVRIQGLEANKAALEEQVDQLQTQLDRIPSEQETLNHLSSYDISQRIPIKKIVKAIGHKIGSKVSENQPRLSSVPTAVSQTVSSELTGRSIDSDCLNILLVYPEVGNPTRYRVINQAGQMELLGYRPTLRAINELDTASDILAQTDLLYLYRLESTQSAHQLVDSAKQLKIPVVFDTDDMIWDQKLELYCFLKDNLSVEEIESVLATIRRHEIIMQEIDYFVASTDYLAQLLRNRFGKRVFVNENALSEEAQILSAPFFHARQERGPVAPSSPVTIVYVSGWPRAHQEDFGVVVEPLRQLIKDRSQVRIKIVGHLDTSGLFTGYEDRLEHLTFVEWDQVPEALSSAEINLAPIVNNPHRCSKSGIKFSEAALVGLPTVASNLEPYQDIRHGQTGYLATTPEEWYDCLIKLVDSPKNRWTMGIAAREQVMMQDTVRVRSSQYKLVIQQILEDYRG